MQAVKVQYSYFQEEGLTEAEAEANFPFWAEGVEVVVQGEVHIRKFSFQTKNEELRVVQ